MRIACFVRSFPELSETFILRQVTGLLDRGHEVGIFAYRAAGGGPAHEAVDRYGLRGLVRLLPHREDSAPPRLRGVGPAGPAARCVRREHARALGGWRTLARTLAALAAEERFDVVHCHYGDLGLRYRVAARFWAAPLVVSFYGFDASAYPGTHGSGVYRPLFRRAGAVASLSAHMDGRLRELGCPDALLRRVPLAVDPAEFAPAERPARRPGDPVRLLTVARLTEKKGVEHALRALALAGERFPALRYDVVGDGPLRGSLEALAASLGLGERVRFLGARTGAFVREAMRGADLFLLPSVTAGDGDQEGTPTVLLEAACCGLPVLATRHAGIPEVVLDGESGFLVPERDPAALADALERLLLAPERWAELGRAGRLHVERTHGTAAVAERLEGVYRELLAGRAGARPAPGGATAPSIS
jgi:colanic acid/amylovoran biosynthesis glycosyltransferase